MTDAWMHGVLRSAGVASAHEIIKVGGSLLALPGWPALVAELVRDRAARRAVLVVVGGGAIVDGLRAIDLAAPQPPMTTHAVAIDLMGATARLVAAALRLPLVVDRPAGPAAVLDVPRWLAVPGRFERLPPGWDVTSDSIAAEIACVTGGDLLVAKRVAPPRCPDGHRLEQLAHSGWVDDHFPRVAAGVAQITWAAPTSVPEPGVGGAAVDGRDPRRE